MALANYQSQQQAQQALTTGDPCMDALTAIYLADYWWTQAQG